MYMNICQPREKHFNLIKNHLKCIKHYMCKTCMYVCKTFKTKSCEFLTVIIVILWSVKMCL